MNEPLWTDKLAEELHKPIRRKFIQRRVISNGIDHIWSADLIEMQPYSKENDGVRYLLNVIDVFSKYAWSKPLKNKTGNEVTEAFGEILKEGRKCKLLWVDEGTEFYNKVFLKFLDDNDIKIYHTFNQGKAVIIERFNKTMKTWMWKYFSANNTFRYIDMLPDLINKYNNKKHRSIKMSPKEASLKKNEGRVYYNLYGDMEQPLLVSKFKVGDKVRISKIKRKFEKGYWPNFTEENFIVRSIQYTNPLTYTLTDLDGEEIKGSFYEQELQKTDQEIFRIEKVIRKDNKKKQALVKWRGYPEKFNSWIPLRDIVKL